MAIITTGSGVASISGSIGGTTFSRNRGGAYMRTRAVPTNPNTAQQQAVRSLVAQLAALWTNVLTAAQRTSWETYAENVLLPNALGQQINIGAVAHYIRSNVTRLQAGLTGLTRIDDAPVVFNLGDYTAPTVVSATGSSDVVSVGFDNTDEWANEDGAAMLWFGSRAKGAAINYFKGPYRYAGSVEGDAVTPPTSPAAINNPFSVEAGDKTFMRAVVCRADGRFSTPFRGFGIGI